MRRLNWTGSFRSSFPRHQTESWDYPKNWQKTLFQVSGQRSSEFQSEFLLFKQIGKAVENMRSSKNDQDLESHKLMRGGKNIHEPYLVKSLDFLNY